MSSEIYYYYFKRRFKKKIYIKFYFVYLVVVIAANWAEIELIPTQFFKTGYIHQLWKKSRKNVSQNFQKSNF